MSARGVKQDKFREAATYLYGNRLIIYCRTECVAEFLQGKSYISDTEKNFLREQLIRGPRNTIVVSCVPHLCGGQIQVDRLFKEWDSIFNDIHEQVRKMP